jgi:endonuclease III
MNDDFHPLFLKSLTLIAKLEDEFLELASTLRQLQQMSPKDFKKAIHTPQLGRRKAYYLVSIDKAFGDKTVPDERLKKIGWTKLAALAPHITEENQENALLFAEMNTVKDAYPVA